MGTSKGYTMPTGGDWTPLKTEASKFVKNNDDGEGIADTSTAHLVNRYLNVLKSSGYGNPGGGGGGGTSGSRGGGTGGGFGSAATKTGQALGGFLSSVAKIGLTETLREYGLADLIGKSAEEVIIGLTNAFTDPASSLDEEAARVALYELQNDLLEECETFEDIEESFMEVISETGIIKTIVDFFGRYIYRIFCRDFYEGWQKKAGAEQAARKLDGVKGYIFSSLKDRFTGETADKNWAGKVGLQTSQQILKDTVEVYIGAA